MIFNYLTSLPTYVGVFVVASIMLCLIALTASMTYVLVHRKIKLKLGEKELDVQDDSTTPPAAEVKNDKA